MIVFETIGTILSYIIVVPIFIWGVYIFFNIWGNMLACLISLGEKE